MPKLLQINVTSNWGSTGKIAEECNFIARLHGWDTYFAFGRYSNPSESKFIFGPLHPLNIYEHYIENKIIDNEGLASRKTTNKLVEKIREIQPDIIHLHNIHDHWLNYKILFEYLNQTDIKIVWTFHDFWAVTGHCAHFVTKNCSKFQNECYDCPMTKNCFFPIIKRENRNFKLKRKLFSVNKNLTIIPVSEWVGENVRKSFLKGKPMVVIPNGVDTNVFKPTPLHIINNGINEKLNGKFVIMAVSSQWKSASKGLDDYKSMSKILKDDEVIVLVGVPNEISKDFPNNIIGIPRTNNQQELAALYTRADVVCSFSSAETFGLSIVEGYACGTPAVVYDNTAQPSLITQKTGYVVPSKDYKSAYMAIQEIKRKGSSTYYDDCINLARVKYNKSDCFSKYIKLYESLIN